eukprot:c11573_g1_i1.p1 GENE.c11573_g1_i1~~c11573_g1_i1.p1  ORF type:complete len:607 (+),score=108.72 c11573_g1_i1:26-1822(+)
MDEWSGWPHYFPGENLTNNDSRIPFISRLKSYFCGDAPPFVWPRDCNAVDSVFLDYDKFIKAGPIPQFGQQLLNDPLVVVGCIGVALYSAFRDRHQSVQPGQYPIPFRDRKICPRIINFHPQIPLREIKSNMICKFVSVKGNVIRVSGLRPLVTAMPFECQKCRERTVQHFVDGKYQTPEKCSTSRCRGRTFIPIRDEATMVDWQKIRIQEVTTNTDAFDAGRVPRTLEVELTDDMVDSCTPGDIVVVCGVIKAVSMEGDGRGRSQKSKTLFVLYLSATSVITHKGTFQSHETGHTEYSVRDLYGISTVAEHPRLFEFLVWSLCPAIYGHEVVKAGLLMTLFGGNQRRVGAAKIRSDAHILLVGDPGLGKSQMLQAVCHAAPRGVYVCGNTASTSGLTVAVVRDPMSGDFALEAGALVMGDQGVCCIDEFDKMGQEHMALLEAMEQQTISVAKAGIVCSLAARTSVVAAANPAGGHYNASKTVNENIRMSTAILSRFDLVFILLDRPNEEMDRLLSEHVMALHAGGKSGKTIHNKAQRMSSPNSERDGNRPPINERLTQAINEMAGGSALPPYLLRKYISYARKYVNPVWVAPNKQSE